MELCASSKNIEQVLAQLKSGDTLVLTDREYHFYKESSPSRVIHMTNTDSFKNPEKHFAMLLEGLEGVTLDGGGATLFIHGDICALALLGCKGIVLKNFKINYPSPANAEMRVVAVDGKSVTYKIPETTSWKIKGKSIIFSELSPLTGEPYWEHISDKNSYCGVCHTGGDVYRTQHIGGVFFGIRKLERLADDTVKITYFSKKNYRVGDIYTFSPNWNRHTCGIFFNECKDIVSQNIEVNYLAGFGWLTQMCENVAFDSICFKPDDAHIVSSFADLIHVCGCKGRVDIKNCCFSHPHDDGINIHGAFLRFKKKLSDTTAEFEFVHKQQGGYRSFYEGDRVRLYYRNSLAQLGDDFTVISATDNIDSKTVVLELDKPLPQEITARHLLQSNIVIENISYCPEVEISNCTFKSIPTRGILCTTSGKVKVHANTFSQVLMANIFISNDAGYWYESGPVRDFEIYDNEFDISDIDRFRNIDAPAVLVEPITLGRKVKGYVHSGISIHSNTIKSVKKTAVKAIGVDGIRIEDNEIVNGNEITLVNCRESK